MSIIEKFARWFMINVFQRDYVKHQAMTEEEKHWEMINLNAVVLISKDLAADLTDASVKYEAAVKAAEDEYYGRLEKLHERITYECETRGLKWRPPNVPSRE